MTLRILAVAVLLADLLSHDPQVFRSASRTVYIYATVQDRDGRLVPNLRREDFEVLDNGRPQAITTFADEPQALTLAAMFDMSASMLDHHARLRQASIAFIDALWSADRVRLGSFGTEIALSPLLTSDKPTLRRIVDEELWPGGGTPLWAAIDAAMTSLNGEPGRRVVLAFTDGKDSQVAAIGRNGRKAPEFESFRQRIESGEFMLYAVGLEGADQRAEFGADGMTGPILDLANDSGGSHVIVMERDDLGRVFAGIVDELHSQYAIGFSPDVLDGKAHVLTVRAKPRGLKVRARRSYLASSDRP
jgi:Ca-activated chloride channel family protein